MLAAYVYLHVCAQAMYECMYGKLMSMNRQFTNYDVIGGKSEALVRIKFMLEAFQSNLHTIKVTSAMTNTVCLNQFRRCLGGKIPPPTPQ